MNRMLSLITLTAVLAVLSPALAAPGTPQTQTNPYLGGNVTREYRAEDLKTSYGILDVAMQDIWVLTMPDTVVDVITSKEGVLQFSQRGQRVVIGALASSGSYPVLVMTQDSVYFFQIRLSPSRGGGIRNVLVRADEAPVQEQVFPGFPATPAAPSSPSVGMVRSPAVVTPVPTPVASPVPVTPMPSPAPVAPARPAPTAAPALPAAPAASPPVLALPSIVSASGSPAGTALSAGVPSSAPVARQAQAPVSNNVGPVQAQFAATVDGNQTVIYYRVSNQTEGDLLLDEASLRVTVAGNRLPHRATKTTVRVPPGRTEYGTVILTSVPQSFRVEWAASRFGTGQSVQLSQIVNVDTNAFSPKWNQTVPGR